ncbi:MAG: ParB/RepB/Spo0J family partition protein [Candidatus Sumerlaeota bacterium]|nr:ParB/RepB/Spo0J family partition protein [Candidatus Sumerlaeota bacterium]
MPSDSLLEIPLAEIQANPDQPRQDFPEGSLDELALSIKAHGVIQPVVVRRLNSGYRLIAGERRVRAARKVGLDRIAARVLEDTDDGALEKALVENLQREDLNPIHEARAFQKLMERAGLTQEQVAERVGKSRAAVANTLRLLRLPQAVQSDILAGRLSEGHARAILALEDAKHQLSLRDHILREGLSVRQAEALSRSILEKTSAPARPRPAGGASAPKDASIAAIEERLTLRFGARVRIQAQSAKKGRIVIPYRSLEEFERILGVLGVDLED